MNKRIVFSFVVFVVFSMLISHLTFSQEHSWAGKKFGNLVFMKNLTTDSQTDFSSDSCNYLETSRGTIPDLWVRAFLKNNLQHYIDYMKSKHDKITTMSMLLAFTINPVIYADGKEVISQYGNMYDAMKGEEKFNIENFSDYSSNTVLFKFSELESFINHFSFKSKNLAKNQTCLFKISCTLKFLCIYVNPLEKTKAEYYKDDKGWDIVAIKSEEVNASDYDFFKLMIK